MGSIISGAAGAVAFQIQKIVNNEEECKLAELSIAHGGFEAIEKAEAVKPDIILMKHPYAISGRIGGNDAPEGHSQLADTPMIALTVLAMSGDRAPSSGRCH